MTEFTFEQLKQMMNDRLKLLSDFKDTLFHSVYQRIIDVVAFTLEKLAYLSAYYYRESSWKDAQNRSSLLHQAYFLNYVPHRKTGAFGNVLVVADTTFAIPFSLYTGPSVVIPKWTEFSDGNGEKRVYSTEEKTYYTNTTIVNKTINAAASAVDLGDGLVGFPITAHQIPIGVLVTIEGSENYDGNYTSHADTTTNELVIETEYTAETFQGDEKVFTGHILIPVKEGTPKEFIYTASGVENETFTIFSDKIDNDEYEVFIVDSLENVLANVNVVEDPFFINDLVSYSVEVINADDFSAVSFKFGDGFFTRKLLSGENVLVKFSDTNGEEGNITGINIISKFKTIVRDSNGNIATYLGCRNNEQISDGAGYENLEAIRKNGRRLFYAGYRAGSKTDWLAIVEAHPSVNKAIIWTAIDLGQTTIGSDQNLVHITAVSNDGSGLTISQQDDISLNNLIPKKSVTEVISWEQLDTISLKFDVTAKVKNVPFTQVRDEINMALSTEWDILNVAFAEDIFESNYIRIIDEIDNVIYHTTIANYVETNTEVSQNLYSLKISKTAVDEADPAKQIFLSSNTFEIWIKRKVAGEWELPKKICGSNGTSLTPILNYNFGNGPNGIITNAISLVTNTITYQIISIMSNVIPSGEAGATFGVKNPTATDLNGYILYLVYRTQDGNGAQTKDIRLKNFNQIVDFDPELTQFSLSYL